MSIRATFSRMAAVPNKIETLGSSKNGIKDRGRIFAIAARFASTDVAERSSGGFFSWLAGESSSQIPPLNFPIPCVTLPPLPDYVEPCKTKITTLPNGAKIASETSTSHVASIGLYVDCGSVYETPSSFGATHLLERMTFKTTKNRSRLRIVCEIEAIGGSVMASGSREQIRYTYDALKTYMPEMVEVLIDSVRNAIFLDWEINEHLKKVKAELGELSNNPQDLLLEAIHSAAYYGALANPLIASESTINRLNGTILEEFVVANYTSSRMVLAASGVEHEELLSIAEPLLSDLPKVPRLEEPKSYMMEENISADQIHRCMLMGGGGSFSAGGPGKGVHSRLYLNVLNNFQQIESFSAFNSIYNHTSIFGIHATTGLESISKAIDLAARELLGVATPGQVDLVELDRAKESTKSAVVMNRESREPIEHFLKVVNEVTLKDITSSAQKIISSPLTMAS
ncbi:mitochondrial-processing peptidase subunit alpha [Canna indica]|uniref:Mitochondrial-processing peptidase subunit alpha n=1 Tax=Canna indica TaxID=4628 RepID=A0AAQ3KJR3_9LILI|nr:mitochondrial-processing peptidase subunit alpha [Canna indica]